MLDGPSSSGKTTLAIGVQERLIARGDCWIVMGVDDWFAKLPKEWAAVRNHRGVFADDGVVLDTTGGSFEMRMGRVGDSLLRAYRDAVGAAARAGLNVIVDDVQLREVEWAMWQTATADLDVTWVKVRIDLDILEAREVARGDRVIGMARWQYDQVHRFASYDLIVDTGVLDQESAADAVFAALA